MMKPLDASIGAGNRVCASEGEATVIEDKLDIPLISRQAKREKQSQQTYRPVIGVHKWFARRAGSLFRGLLIAEFRDGKEFETAFFQSNALSGLLVADPFMGGGTPIFEAVRLGCNVIGCDVNPVAYWVVRQEIGPLDREAFLETAQAVIKTVDERVGPLYRTTCVNCGNLEAVAKYFFWVKQATCGACSSTFDLFSSYLVAKNERHPKYVLHCPHCTQLIESQNQPENGASILCPECGGSIGEHGPADRRSYICPYCQYQGRYPASDVTGAPPRHRLYGIEYFCTNCFGKTEGRLYKTPDETDQARYVQAGQHLANTQSMERILPNLPIPDGEETRRPRQWGYRNFRELFNDRQLFVLGTLASAILEVQSSPIRHALITVFSDIVRYHNLLCRYDSYALKGQDVFAVHSFPVSLTHCENNVLGIPGVGSGGFRHFVAKYDRAKEYCENPFEVRWLKNGGKETVCTSGEYIVANFAQTIPDASDTRQAFLTARSIADLELQRDSLDAVLTDPPYFDNVQYAELTDLHYVWLKHLLGPESEAFRAHSSRSPEELRINGSEDQSIESFTVGLSRIFCYLANALKPDAPFAFTYHHSRLEAYLPLAVAILDAKLRCTATFPYPSEMVSSLHISRTNAPVVDTVIVCRKFQCDVEMPSETFNLRDSLARDRDWLNEAGFAPRSSDLMCLAYGHLVRAVAQELAEVWNSLEEISTRLSRVHRVFTNMLDEQLSSQLVEELASRECVGQ